MIDNLIVGFSEILSIGPFLAVIFGVIVGLFVGAMPGINDTITMSILVPVTFGMAPSIAFPILIGVYVSACTGGSIPAILIGIPGTISSIVTLQDGYPMAARGEQEQALSIAIYASAFAGLFSSFVLIFLTPFLAKQALKFGPPEYFVLGILGLAAVSGFSKDVIKGLIVSAFGLIISTIGLGFLGYYRYGLGTLYLLDGLPLISMMIGYFGISSLLKTVSENVEYNKINSFKNKNISLKKLFLKTKMLKRLWPTMLRSSIIGTICGVIPGVGMGTSTFVSYNFEKNIHSELEFGTGVPEGIAAAEGANNSVVASSMVPLLSLGIPGNSTSAIFISAMMIQGMRPGPLLFRDRPEVVYMMIAAFLVANIFMWIFAILLGNLLALSIIKLPKAILNGAIITICVTGCFAINHNINDLWVMIIFGLLCYILDKFDYPTPPLFLGFILGGMIERSFLQSMILSGKSLNIFFTRPLSFFLLILVMLSIFYPAIKSYKNHIKKDYKVK